MFCPHCGKPVEGGRFCPHCGKSLMEQGEVAFAPAPAVAPPPRPLTAEELLDPKAAFRGTVPTAASQPVGAAVSAPPPVREEEKASAPAVETEVLRPEMSVAPVGETEVLRPEMSAAPAGETEVLRPEKSATPAVETEVLRPEMTSAPVGETEVLSANQHYPAGETDPALSRQTPVPAGKRQVLRPDMAYSGNRQPDSAPGCQTAAQPASGQPGYGFAPNYQPVSHPAPAAGTLPEKASPLKALALVFGWIGFGLYVMVMCIFMVSHVVRILPYATADSFLAGLLLPLGLLLGMAVFLASCVAVGRSRAMTLVGMLFSAALLGLIVWYSNAVNWPVLVLMAAAGGVLAVVAGLLGVFVKPSKRGVGVLVVIVVFAVLCLLCLAIWVLTGSADWLLARTALLGL